MKRPLIQRFRSFVIDQTAGLMNLTSNIRYADLDREVGWRDHLRWFIEGRLSTVFGWAYEGSDEEIEAVYRSELPLDAMGERQRAVLTRPRSEYGAHCITCRWDGWWDECDGDHDCPICGRGIYLDAFEEEAA